jgi:hypothetical protein
MSFSCIYELPQKIMDTFWFRLHETIQPFGVVFSVPCYFFPVALLDTHIHGGLSYTYFHFKKLSVTVTVTMAVIH